MEKIEYEFYLLVLMVIAISFLGWCFENLWLAVTKGFVDNRCMSLPFLLGYGLFIVVLYLCLGTPQTFFALGGITLKKSKWKRYLTYFCMVMFVVSIGEILLGSIVEKFCGFAYWNYSWIPMHITKFTSIPTSIGFACIITFLMAKYFTPLMNLLLLIPVGIAKTIASTGIIALISDFVISFKKMYKTRQLNIKWRKELNHKSHWVLGE